MIFHLLLSVVAAQMTVNGLPYNWWLNSTGLQVTSWDHYKELIMSGDDSQFRDKHVFIDFFMKHCPYCYAFQDQWNLIVSSMEAKYNDGDYKQVVFLQADKDELSYLLRKYGVRSFPTFVYVKPGTNGKTANRFQENRSYESLKKWMEK